MPKIIVTAEVEDAKTWEVGFRTHGDLFRAQTCRQIEYSINFVRGTGNSRSDGVRWCQARDR